MAVEAPSAPAPAPVPTPGGANSNVDAKTAEPGPAAQPAPTLRPLYEASTQFSNWRYSPEQLHATRTALNAAAVDAIRQAFESDEPGSSQNVAFLDAKDEQLLVRLYVSKIPQLCGHFRFPEEVEATAISYLKRFYLKNTVMDWHPKNVMLTALFLATKTTNHPISLEAYTSHIPRTAPADVLDLEFLVAQSLSFEFAIWHVHRALWGLWLDIQTLPDGAPPDSWADKYDAALAQARTSRLTDAELIYAPSQIALACLSLVAPELAASWAATKGVSALLSPDGVVPAICALLARDGAVPDVDAVREVDRRLRLCKNPEKVPGSRAFLARQAEREKKAGEKRSRKAEVARRAMDEGDPFGQVIEKGTGGRRRRR